MQINLDQLRQQISATDAQILALIAERLDYTRQVAETKIANHTQVRDPAREERLLVSLIKQGSDLGLDPLYITKLFHVIIEHSVLQQQALVLERANPLHVQPLQRVAFLGAKGSYSYLASKRFFARRAGELHDMGFRSFEEVVTCVEHNEADYAVLPIENTTSGSINEVYDLLQHTSLHIVGEVTQPVEHALLVKPEITDIAQVQRICGHPQALAQCRAFIDSHSHLERQPTDNTSAAMQRVSQSEGADSAALGSVDGGAEYGLIALHTAIANQKENHTRFIVVARQPVKVPLQIPAKTTLVMLTMQKTGALVDALAVLKANNINMTKLESRPIWGNPWEEMFYLDLDGNVQDGPMQQALEELRAVTRSIQVLGCYACEDVSHTKVAVHNTLVDIAQDSSS